MAKTRFGVKKKTAALELLRCAKEKLEKVGWGQGALAWSKRGGGMMSPLNPEEEIGGYCMIGAIYACANSETEYLKRYRHYGVSLYYEYTPPGVARLELEADLTNSIAVEGFNDEGGRTKEEVLAQIQKTIERLEKEVAE